MYESNIGDVFGGLLGDFLTLDRAPALGIDNLLSGAAEDVALLAALPLRWLPLVAAICAAGAACCLAA